LNGGDERGLVLLGNVRKTEAGLKKVQGIRIPLFGLLQGRGRIAPRGIIFTI